jgi:serine phosphatase RsbU (regulator of sigma subunit)
MCLFKAQGDLEKTFVTLFLVAVGSTIGEPVYSSVGHSPPLLREKDGAALWISDSVSLPFGVSDNVDCHSNDTELP